MNNNYYNEIEEKIRQTERDIKQAEKRVNYFEEKINSPGKTVRLNAGTMIYICTSMDFKKLSKHNIIKGVKYGFRFYEKPVIDEIRQERMTHGYIYTFALKRDCDITQMYFKTGEEDKVNVSKIKAQGITNGEVYIFFDARNLVMVSRTPVDMEKGIRLYTQPLSKWYKPEDFDSTYDYLEESRERLAQLKKQYKEQMQERAEQRKQHR